MMRRVAWGATLGVAAAFDVTGAAVVGVQGFPTAYEFWDAGNGSMATLREVSACRRDGAGDLVLVGDEGELFGAAFAIGAGGGPEIAPTSRVALRRRPRSPCDAEGVAIVRGAVVVSTEWHEYATRGTSELDVAVFDAATGRYVASPRASGAGPVRRRAPARARPRARRARARARAQVRDPRRHAGARRE